MRSEWTLANNKNNELCNVVFGDNVARLTQAEYRRYYSTNGKALDAFLARKEAGLSLSDRVWRYSDTFRNEIEMGLDIGIRSGLDAPAMARELQTYLQHPDKLFRRVADEHGHLHLSKAAAAFHPGRGVYRSSYMNARRLAATETNIAYRTADHLRWQQMDFVVGIRVQLSNNHNCRGVPEGAFFDICDEIKGDYPKDFKFTGWHPHCRCYATPILKTPEELAADNQRIMQGEEPAEESENAVTMPPREWFDWLRDNWERAKTQYSVPYFLLDNEKYIPKDYIKLYASRMPYKTYAEYEAAMKFNKKNAKFTKEQRANIRELNKVMPVVQGKLMSFRQADESRNNPNFSHPLSRVLGYKENCQTCTISYELRRRGFDIEAMPSPYLGKNCGGEFYDFCERNGLSWKDRFLNTDGSQVTYTRSGYGINNTYEGKLGFIETATQKQGRYEVYCDWKGNGAHVFIVERQRNGNLLWFDPQSGEYGGTIERYINNARHFDMEVLRIDDKLINPKFAERFLKSGT